jgi:hypothetical protein
MTHNWGQSHKTILEYFYSHFFGKQDHFINISNVYSIAMKWSSLQKRVSKCAPKMFYEIDSCGLYYECFTFIIYDRNDSGQYYKTTITIVIDDPS